MNKFNNVLLISAKLRFATIKGGIKWLGSRLFTAILIIAAIIFVAIFVIQSIRIRDMQSQYDHKKAEFALIEERNQRLKEHLDFLNSPGYMLFVEKVAREKLGLAKPDETVILPVYTEPTTAPATGQNQPKPQAPPPQQTKPAWQAWLGFFFGQ
jgi:cell division protein FtsB